MKKESSSLDIYKQFKRIKPTVKDIENLLETMKAELVINSYSSLLDASFNECVIYYNNMRGSIRILNSFQTHHYYLSKTSNYHILSTLDAWQFAIFLSNYMNGSLSLRNIETWLPYFGKDYRPNVQAPEVLLQEFKKIDNLIIELRKKMYYIEVSENSKNSSCVISEDTKQQITNEIKDTKEQKNESIARTYGQAESRANEIIGQAQSDANEIIEQAESKANEIIDSAQQKATKIIDDAAVTADKKIADAKKRILELSADKKLDEYNTEHNNMEQCFFAVREALVKANESIKLLEDSVYESITRKAHTQLIELYNLIADTKDSTFSLAMQTNSQELENAAYNMDVFLDMLVEYLADYGIQTIISSQGDPFSAKHHIGKTGISFDSRNARISRSLRNGFIWGEQVLQKERIEIEGDKYVSWN